MPNDASPPRPEEPPGGPPARPPAHPPGWDGAALGDAGSWPIGLRVAHRLVAATRQPALILWGEALLCLPNAAMAGAPGPPPDLAGRPFREAWPEAWDRLGPRIRAAMRGAAPGGEEALLDPPGWEVALSPVEDPAAPGGIGGVLLLARDAPSRLRAEQARFQALVDATSEMVFSMSPDWSELRRLPRGGARAEAGPPERDWIVQIIPPADRPRMQAAIAEAVRGRQTFELEHRVTRPDGSTGWLLSRAVPILGPEGEVVEWFGTASDVTARRLAEEALRESEARLLLAQEAADLGVYERDLLQGQARWSPAMFRLWGLDPARFPDFLTDTDYMALLLPEDRARHRARRDAQRDNPEVTGFASEFRIRRADTGEIRWIASRGEYVRDATGRAVLVRGINQDITERRLAEECQALLAREVDHRAKNMLAVVQAVVGMTPSDDPAAFRRAVSGRIAALARAQNLLAGDRWAGADLRALLEGEIAPFRAEAHRVVLDGPAVTLPPGTAQAMAMATHELATNALKYGALSCPGGSIAVTWRREGEVLRLRWAESGGPPVEAPPRRRGFGSRVLDGTLRRQLGGEVSLAWDRTGLVCDVAIPLRKGRG